jgi:inner membrane protein
MPTVLSHAVVALATAPWLRPRMRWPLLAAGTGCTMLPDADTLGRHLHVPALELAHRGATHSFVFALAAAAVVAWAGRAAWREVPLRTAFAFLFLCVLSHPLLDMATSGGPGIALGWPFTDARLFFPWRPIAVSPLDADRFFGPRGLAVLASEARWLWAPGFAIAALGLGLRQRAEPAR